MLILDIQVSIIIHNKKQNIIQVNLDIVIFDVALLLHDDGGEREKKCFLAILSLRGRGEKKHVLSTEKKANK